MSTIVRHLVGYAVGIGIFWLAIPLGFLRLAQAVDPRLGTGVTACAATRLGLALVLAAVGLVFALGSNVALLFVGHGGPADGFGVAVSPRTRRLVTTGLYRVTRNPMVFGMNLLYLALVLYLGSVSGLVALSLFVTALRPYLRWAEERRLLKDFGAEYVRYRQQTPLLFPCWSRAHGVE
jgi:protein-S-isoprenylcysteine O-methyltransferase Ste14